MRNFISAVIFLIALFIATCPQKVVEIINAPKGRIIYIALLGYLIIVSVILFGFNKPNPRRGKNDP
jgi:Na+-translocating ferredoxin:NAD+ oxidoreductase RnfD subunit